MQCRGKIQPRQVSTLHSHKFDRTQADGAGWFSRREGSLTYMTNAHFLGVPEMGVSGSVESDAPIIPVIERICQRMRRDDVDSPLPTAFALRKGFSKMR